MKYTLVKISGVATSIAKPTEVKGYTVSILETVFPDDSEMDVWSKKQSSDWVKQNNKRMEAICKFLNENNL